MKKQRVLSASSLDAKDTRSEAETLVERCTELEADIAELWAKYEQFFLGVERRPPSDAHERIKREVTRLRQSTVRQTAAKFRVQSLHNKLLTYERLWARTLLEMEAGTYRRDMFKARLHREKREAAEKKLKPPEEQKTAEAPKQPEAQKPAPVAAARAPVAAAMAAVAPPGGLSDAKLKAIYDAYVMAKRRCNEDVSKLSYESVASTLKAQVPTLMKQHNAKSVEFKVVIKDGKAVLRALPKE